MDTLRLKNEEVRAVGNMNVNARGDRLDSNNKTVDSRNRRVSRQYKKQTNVVDQPVADNLEDAKNKIQQVENVAETANTEVELHNAYNDDRLATTYDLEDTVEQTTETPQEKPDDEPQGLAAAIASLDQEK
jgi:predicted RND superfamily exporter protein